MRECRRVFSRRSLLWLLVLMAAVVFFHRVDHHNAPGFAAAYRQTVAQLAASRTRLPPCLRWRRRAAAI